MLGDAGVEPASLLELVDEADVGLGEPAVPVGARLDDLAHVPSARGAMNGKRSPADTSG